ncbi:MAG: D-alanine--D-alanine ligase [Lachnospiraceae bacterium]|nr:D-alanine--D-alanine ligase [Lachnospiraceae bacterium]
MKIVVLAGGTSTEREVSLNSGKMVCKALKSKGHEAVLLDVFMGYESETPFDLYKTQTDADQAAAELSGRMEEVEELVKLRKKEKQGFFGPNVLTLCKDADVVFMALHGQNGEDGKIQAVFELLGITYTGAGYLGSALAMDKGLSKQIFIHYQVPTPKSVLFTKAASIKEMPFKGAVVKPCCGGSSVGVTIAHTQEEYEKALDAAFALEEEVLVEEYVSGREFSIGVMNGRALPVIEIEPLEGFYDYTNKYQAGKTKETCPANLSEEITKKLQKEAEHAYRALKLEVYARIDFLLDAEDNIYCLEANTLPGMTATSLLPQEAAAEGVSFEELCETIVLDSMKVER